jgi:tetratricopeptide (TPR) repeat protein
MVRSKAAYERLLREHPKSSWAAQAELGLGLIDLHQQAFESALTHFKKVASRTPETTVTLDGRLFEGLAHLQLKQYAEAIAVFEPLLSRLPPEGVAQAAFYLGEAHSGRADYANAVTAYQQAISVSKTLQWSQPAQFGLGWALYRTDQCEPSIKAFDHYLAKAADHRTEALFAQAGCLMKLDREQDAIGRFEKILQSQPAHPLAVESGMILADLHRRDADFDAAKDVLHRMLKSKPTDETQAHVRVKLGSIALEQATMRRPEPSSRWRPNGQSPRSGKRR